MARPPLEGLDSDPVTTIKLDAIAWLGASARHRVLCERWGTFATVAREALKVRRNFFLGPANEDPVTLAKSALLWRPQLTHSSQEDDIFSMATDAFLLQGVSVLFFSVQYHGIISSGQLRYFQQLNQRSAGRLRQQTRTRIGLAGVQAEQPNRTEPVALRMGGNMLPLPGARPRSVAAPPLVDRR